MSEHAISNARAWIESITDAITALQELESGEESVTFEGDSFDDADELRQRIDEMPLSVSVRTGWFSPGAKEDAEPEEFEILLSTGGPALRVYGEIDGTPYLQWQDWGTPWTSYHDTTNEQDDALQVFVQRFYFGD